MSLPPPLSEGHGARFMSILQERDSLAEAFFGVDRAELDFVFDHLNQRHFPPIAQVAETLLRRRGKRRSMKTALGVGGVSRNKVRQNGEPNSIPVPRFTKDTAEITGRSERSIQKDAQRV